MLDIFVLLTLGFLVRFVDSFRQILYMVAGFLVYEVIVLKIFNSEGTFTQVLLGLILIGLCVTAWLWLLKRFDDSSISMYFITLVGGMLILIRFLF